MFLVALIAFFGFAVVIDNGDDSDVQDTADQQPTDGDDVIRIDDDNPVADLDLLEGDDRGSAFIEDGSILRGGDGADTLSGGTGSTIFGDAGDDELGISSYNGSRPDQTNFDSAAFGGDGDDILFSDRGFVEEGTVRLFGDAGDDLLQTRTEAGDTERNGITKILNGGTGNDAFEVQVFLTRDDDLTETRNDDSATTPRVVLEDFTPGEDSLVLVGGDLFGFSDPNDPNVPALDTANLLRSGDDTTTLELTFVPVGNEPPIITHIGLGGAPDITLDDIVFMNI